jgi:hypothetical protein
MTVEGGWIGVGVTANAHASLAGVTVRDPGWAAVGIFDDSVAHIEDWLLDNTDPSDGAWRQGLAAMKGTIAVHGTRIRNMQVGIEASSTPASPGEGTRAGWPSPTEALSTPPPTAGGRSRLLARLGKAVYLQKEGL